MDISTFTAGILIRIKEGKIKKARLAFGGVGPVVLRLPKVENFLKGIKFFSLYRVKLIIKNDDDYLFIIKFFRLGYSKNKEEKLHSYY